MLPSARSKRGSRPHSLTEPFFLLALLLLLANDLYLKAAFPNAFTGKLSDFAGLFVFGVLWCSFFPRALRTICILTGAFFIFWKSPWSQWAIEAWNDLPLFRVGRTVDWSDLMALSVLPLVYLQQASRSTLERVRVSPVLPFILACFAITATSYRSKIEYRKDYDFSFSSDTLRKRLYFRTDHVRGTAMWEKHSGDTSKFLYVHRYAGDTMSVKRYDRMEEDLADTLSIRLRDSVHGDFRANVLIEGKGDRSKLRLFHFRINAPEKEKHAERLPKVFEERLIEDLRRVGR